MNTPITPDAVEIPQSQPVETTTVETAPTTDIEVIVWPDVKQICTDAKTDLNRFSRMLRHDVIIDTITYLRRRYTADMHYADRAEAQQQRLAYAFELDRELTALERRRA